MNDRQPSQQLSYFTEIFRNTVAAIRWFPHCFRHWYRIVLQIHWVCGQMKREQILWLVWSYMAKISIWFNRTRCAAAVCNICSGNILFQSSFFAVVVNG